MPTYTLADFSVSNCGAITYGQTVTGSISSNTEMDLYSISLTAGTTYEFTALGQQWAAETGASRTLRDAFLYITGPSGSSNFVSRYGDDGDVHFFFTPTVSGTYGIGVTGGGELGSYALRAGYLDDVGGSTSAHATLPAMLPDYMWGEIGAVGDHDWYSTYLPPGGTLQVTISMAGLNNTALGLFDPFVRIRDESGNIVAQDDDGAGNFTDSQLNFTTSASGVFYIDVGAYGDRTTGRYSIQVRNNPHLVYDDVFSNTTSFYDVTSLPGKLNRGIDYAGDHDWFRVSLTAGTTYTFDALGFDTMDVSLADPFLALRNSSGAIITQTDSGGLGHNARITFTATSSGYYFLDVSAADGIDVGRYRLTLNNSSSSLPGANPDTFHLLSPGYYTRIPIRNPGEVFVGTIYCQAGQTYTLAANRYGAPGGNGGLSDPYLQVYDSTGATLLWSNDNYGGSSNARITFTATSSGYYQVNVGGSGGATGSVRVFFNSGTAASLDDYGSTPSNRATTALGKTSYATIDSATDHDWFAMALTAGTTYRFTATPDNSIVDAVASADVALRNASSTILTSVSGTGSWGTTLTFTPTATGTYYVDVSGHSGATGAYTLYTALDWGSDPGASTASFADLAIGGGLSGTLGTATDHDWYRVFLTAGLSYTFDLKGSDGGYGNLLDPRLVLRNSFGTVVTADENSGTGLNSRIRYAATSSGYYFLDAGSYLNRYAGTYFVAAQTADDYGSTTASHGALLVMGGVPLKTDGVLEARGDSDWFSITLTPGTYRFNVEGYEGLRDPMATLRNAAGAVLARDDNSGLGLDASLNYVVTAAGTYYVEVTSFMNAYTGSYTVLMGTLDDYGASTSRHGHVSGGAATGALETATDHDWLQVTLAAGTYTFNARGSDTGAGTLANPVLTLRDSAGVALVSDNDTGVGRDARITRTLAAGTYYLDVSSFMGAYAGSYTVEIGAQDDHGASTSTAGAIGLGADNAVYGSLEANGDHDWYQIYLAAGSYVFDLQGAASGGRTLADPYLALRSAAGAQIAVDDNSGPGLDSRLGATITAAGWYFLDAGAWSNAYAGSYRLSATTAGYDDYGASWALCGVTGVGSERAVQGCLERAGDHDWFKVSLTAGHWYDLKVLGAASGQGSLADPSLSIRNAAGQLVDYAGLVVSDPAGYSPEQWNDRGLGQDAVCQFHCSTTGYYYLDVSAFADAYTGSYQVSVFDEVHPEDDYRGSYLADMSASYGVLGLGLDAAASGYISNMNSETDDDWFRISLVAGQQYMFQMTGGWSNGCSISTPFDPYLLLRNSSGTLLAGGTHTSQESRMAWTATASGWYYVDAGSYLGSASGRYTITATTGTAVLDDCGASTTSYIRTAVGRSVSGFFERGSDHDWYAIQLAAGNTYTFNITSSVSPFASPVNPALSLRNGSGVELASNDTFGTLTDGRITYAITSSGWYFLDAYTSTGTTNPAGYALSAALGGSALDDVGSSTASHAVMGACDYAATAMGSIENVGDTDWYQVRLTAGVAYSFYAYGSGLEYGSLADPSLRVLGGPTLAAVASDDNSGPGLDAEVFYTPTATGTYYLEVSGHTGLGTYCLISGATGAHPAAMTSDLSLTPNLMSGAGLGYTFSDEERRALGTGTLASQAA